MNDPNRHSTERGSRDRFDMIVTFTDEAQARRALADLRAAGFGPDRALLLQPEDPSASLITPDGQIKLSTADLLADRAVAIWIIICTECVVGALAGALIGWIVALFLNAPNIAPVWTWMLGLGALGAAAGIALGALEWQRWQRQLDTRPQQIAIGLRFGGRTPAADIARARPILERYGGSGIDNV